MAKHRRGHTNSRDNDKARMLSAICSGVAQIIRAIAVLVVALGRLFG
ncbi:hypothetical protein SAMN04487766_11519 [Actinomyces ruminicola]|uniref:Uncharacterized protein n=1 Tax=Actinomyces ruminicola TaxID=332524 RepID=A0A1G9YZ90_9ACTO|nr:hypothetical protein SAMN04487766_11519 [Actinomyces ruminicola]